MYIDAASSFGVSASASATIFQSNADSLCSCKYHQSYSALNAIIGILLKINVFRMVKFGIVVDFIDLYHL